MPCLYSEVVCTSALYSSHDWSIQLIAANGGNHRAGHADIRNGPASGSGNCNQKAGWRRRWPFSVMDLPEGLSSGPALAREYSPRASNSPSKLRRNGQLRQAPSGPRSPRFIIGGWEEDDPVFINESAGAIQDHARPTACQESSYKVGRLRFRLVRISASRLRWTARVTRAKSCFWRWRNQPSGQHGQDSARTPFADTKAVRPA